MNVFSRVWDWLAKPKSDADLRKALAAAALDRELREWNARVDEEKRAKKGGRRVS